MRLDGVGLRYGRRGPWVLRDVHLELPPGRLIRAQGGNGGGKSTLLRVVAGAARPGRGRVLDRPARTAYVPERFPPALPFTAREYLRLMGRLHGLPVAEAERRGARLLARFGAEGHADLPLARGVAALLVGSVLLLVLSASPANAAVRDVFSSDRTGSRFPLLPLVAVLPLVAACWWASARAAGRAGAAADRGTG